jgi:hypothetical protein
MIIADLSFVESLSATESTELIAGAGAGISVGSQVFALGEFTSTVTDGKAWAFSSPYGSIALGYTLGGGVGYTLPEGGYTLPNWEAWIAQYSTH